MKIGRYTYTGLGYSRRTPIPEKKPAAAATPDPPKRKALLIGITSAGEGYATLKGPHGDVRAMQKLLVEQYAYREADIVVLLDSPDGEERTQPTRVNILRAIDDLVRGAKKGDRFFFHYCGHTTQVENRSNSEEDGMDECLVPVDGEANKILDNELRRHLVAALPVGSHLVAVFDSCHSASLLDLAHFRCNRVYVPWISKGRRRSDERWNAVVRRHALPLFPLEKPPTPSPLSQSNTHVTANAQPSTSISAATSTATSTARTPPLSRSNTFRARSPLGATASVSFAPLQISTNTTQPIASPASAKPTQDKRTKATRKATKRATREMRELMQLLENAPPMPNPQLPPLQPSSLADASKAAGTSKTIPVPPTSLPAGGQRDGAEYLIPTRPNSPLLPSPTTYAHASPFATSPMVATRRIYEAERTSPQRVRAWRTEVDALEVGYSTGVGADVTRKAEAAMQGDQEPVGVQRAETEGDVRKKAGKHKQGKDVKEKPRKRASLPLVPVRLGSILGLRGEQQPGETVEEGKRVKGKEKQKDTGLTERRTTVTRARAVSVAVRQESQNTGSGVPGVGDAEKENATPGPSRRPALQVAVEQPRPVSWLGEEEEDQNRLCDSPPPVYACTGWACRDPAHALKHAQEGDQADVISLASCKDHQISWEDATGGSMTRELVRILKHDPHPTIRALVTNVSHALHRMSLERHLETRKYKRALKKYNKWEERRLKAALLAPPDPQTHAGVGADSRTSVSGASSLAPATPGGVSRASSRALLTSVEEGDAPAIPMRPQARPKAKSEGFADAPVYDMTNFQDPQVASHRPLNMDMAFSI